MIYNDLYKLCFQNYCASLIKVAMIKEKLKLHQSLILGVEGGGQKQQSDQPSLQHLAVTLTIMNICRPNFSEKYDKLNNINTLRKCTYKYCPFLF